MPTKTVASVDHTPGPWRVKYMTSSAEFCVIAPDGRAVAWIDRLVDDAGELGIGNANLIAAASELLAALHGLMHAEWRPVTGPLQYDSMREDAWAAADAAIAKAKGRGES